MAANLTTTAAGKALDATMGKALDDKVAEVNSKLVRNLVSTYKSFRIDATLDGDVTIPLSLTNAPVFLHIASNVNTRRFMQSTYFGNTIGNISMTNENGMLSGDPLTTRCVHLTDSDNGIFCADIKSLSKDALVLSIKNTSELPSDAFVYITAY